MPMMVAKRLMQVAAGSPSAWWGGVRGGGTPCLRGSGFPLSLVLPHEGGGDDQSLSLEAVSCC